jgi:hypothetical protein
MKRQRAERAARRMPRARVKLRHVGLKEEGCPVEVGVPFSASASASAVALLE